MSHRCGPCTSGIVTTTGGGPQRHSFFYTSFQDHVSRPSLPDCGQKTPAPGHLVVQGLKKWHRDSEWQCSHPVLRHEAYSSALFLFPSLKGHVPFLLSEAPQVLFVVLAQAWGRRAEAWHTKGQLHVNQFCPLLCSDLLVFMLNQTVCFTFPD